MKTQIGIKDLPNVVLKKAASQIEKYSTGMSLNGHFIGSGTFVKWRKNFGILTAEHVVNNPTSSKFSLDFSGRESQILQLIVADYPHACALPVSGLSCISLGKRTSDGFGPDSCVILLPECPQLSAIQAKKSFWNLEFDIARRQEQALKDEGLLMMAGHPAEKFEKPGPIKGFKNTLHARGLAGFTFCDKYFERDSFDYLDAKSIRGPTSNALNSYGGMSGGGLWRIHLYKRPDEGNSKIEPDFFLIGNIFWQGPEQDGARIIRAHGPKTIYGALLPKLLAGVEN